MYPIPPGHGRGGDRRPYRSRRGHSRHAISSSSAWATASPRAKAIRTCRCTFRASAPRLRQAGQGSADLTGYPARVGPWKQIGDKNFIEENARWSDQACHRSLYSHQLRAALQLGIEDPHRAVTYVGVACSGSEVTFGLFLRYTGNEWVPNPPDLSQISAIASAQCGLHEAPMQDLPEAYHMNGTIPELQGGLVLRKCDPINARKIDLMFVSVGGNDVGFSRLLANSVLSDESILRSLGGWFGQVHGLTEASAQLDALILATSRSTAPSTISCTSRGRNPIGSS